ncbi:MAG TPA: ester cyclase [Solimonas sp.]|nr:ester cyclase [Solimonas sp.]
MSERENEQFVRRWIAEAWNQRNEEVVRQGFHPEAIAHLEGTEDARGPEALLGQFRLLFGAFPDIHVVIDDLIAKDDVVVMRWSFTGTHLGDSLGPPTGRAVAADGLTWMRFRDGQMVEGWDRWNQGLLLQRLQVP